MKFPRSACGPACAGLVAMLFVCAAHPQRPPRSPLEIPEIRAVPDNSEILNRRLAAEEARRFEARMQDLVRAWNSFAIEYVERGTFNRKKAQEVTKAWRRLESEPSWPKR